MPHPWCHPALPALIVTTACFSFPITEAVPLPALLLAPGTKAPVHSQDVSRVSFPPLPRKAACSHDRLSLRASRGATVPFIDTYDIEL